MLREFEQISTQQLTTLYITCKFMPFEYRIITQAVKALEKYNQLDLYFFKPKFPSVGIKVRFDNTPCDQWQCDELQLKFIKNAKDIEMGLTVLEDWKKICMPVNFHIYTKKYISKNPEKFKLNVGTSIGVVIAQHLQQLNKQICDAILKAQIKEKHFENNSDLAKWVNGENPISEIFLVQKSKLKSFMYEKGQFRISALYGENIKTSVWDTLCFEAHTEKATKSLVMDSGQTIKENISYPKILEKIFFSVTSGKL